MKLSIVLLLALCLGCGGKRASDDYLRGKADGINSSLRYRIAMQINTSHEDRGWISKSFTVYIYSKTDSLWVNPCPQEGGE